jgi:hypothetical protein
MKRTAPELPKDDALTEMRKRYDLASEYCAELYEQAQEDIKFVTVPGNQWDKALKARRKNRPTYEFPKLKGQVRQIINEMRQSRPQGKVRGTEESDAGLAEIMEGLCRNIESLSNADQTYDIAFEKSVKGGFGAFRICTDYLNDDDFEQDIRIKPIRNPFTVKFDPAAVEIDRRDGLFCFVEELIPKSEFERKYPKANVTDFETDRDIQPWRDAKQIRIAEYWYKTPMIRQLWALSSGAEVFSDEAGLTEEELNSVGVTVTQRRDVDSHKVYMRLTNGSEWLTEPYEFPCKYIPIIPVWGNIENIDGQDYWSGAVRDGKDGQRLHNAHRTALVEAVAKAPKAPFVLTPEQIASYEPMWKAANAEDFPYLLYNDAGGKGPPQRTEQAQVPEALIQLAQMDNDDMKAATGMFDPSLGNRSNVTSGVALNSQKQQGQTSTFNYIDNLGYAIHFSYEILVDMIPRVYDTPRVVRILGVDGGEKWKQLYQTVVDPQTGEQHVINDIGKGKYDVSITVGPSFATQRMEAAASFTEMAGQIGSSAPQIGLLLAYEVIKNRDVPGSEEVISAMRKGLVAQGLLPPKDGEPPPQPQPPDPRIQADLEYKQAQAQKMQADAMLQADKQKTEQEIAWFDAETRRIAAIEGAKVDVAGIQQAAAQQLFDMMQGHFDRQQAMQQQAMQQAHEFTMQQTQPQPQGPPQ